MTDKKYIGVVGAILAALVALQVVVILPAVESGALKAVRRHEATHVEPEQLQEILRRLRRIERILDDEYGKKPRRP